MARLVAFYVLSGRFFTPTHRPGPRTSRTFERLSEGGNLFVKKVVSNLGHRPAVVQQLACYFHPDLGRRRAEAPPDMHSELAGTPTRPTVQYASGILPAYPFPSTSDFCQNPGHPAFQLRYIDTDPHGNTFSLNVLPKPSPNSPVRVHIRFRQQCSSVSDGQSGQPRITRFPIR